MYYTIRHNQIPVYTRRIKRKLQRLVWNIRVTLFYSVALILNMALFLSCLAATIFRSGYNIKYFMCVYFSHTFIFFAKHICGLNYIVEGLEKLPKATSVLLSNHQSWWENIFVQIIIPRHSWVIKKELFNLPLFGWCLKMMDPVAVDRQHKTSVKDILTKGVKKLNSGLWLVIFPEAGRLRPNQPSRLKPSGIKLAMIAKVPMVIMVHNAGLFWPKSIWIKRPGTIKVKIVEVIYPEQFAQLDVRTVTDQVQEIMGREKSLLCK
jgi:1-acyl-sn-glycerol-3-phosphate acyltransferase